MVKKCKECNKEFKGKKKQLFCSVVCSGKGQRIERECKECEFTGCTNTFEVYVNSKSNRIKRFCSRTCQVEWQKYSQLGENNGNYGRKNSWGTHSSEKRKEISEKIKKSWENPERLQKHLEFLDRHRLDDGSFDFQDEYFRDRISKANINRLVDNPEYGAYVNCKRGWYTSKKTADDEYFHSSWEEIKMIELDNDKDVLFWTKKHKYVIEYYDNGIKKRYLPDFLIKNVGEEILEVKGYVENVKIFKLKTEAAIKYFSNLGIGYSIDFMKNKTMYSDLIEWVNELKNKYYNEKG